MFVCLFVPSSHSAIQGPCLMAVCDARCDRLQSSWFARSSVPPHLSVQHFPYGRKSVDRIATQSMSKICNLWRLIVVDCDYAESYGWFLSGGNADAVYIVPDDS